MAEMSESFNEVVEQSSEEANYSHSNNLITLSLIESIEKFQNKFLSMEIDLLKSMIESTNEHITKIESKIGAIQIENVGLKNFINEMEENIEKTIDYTSENKSILEHNHSLLDKISSNSF